MITGKTSALGLIGTPVAHSFSPLIHSRFAEAVGFDAAYLAFDVAPEGLSCAIAGAAALGIVGLNVTTPHKIAALSCASVLHTSAKEANAVNTLTLTKNGWEAHNTDIFGIAQAIRRHSSPKGKRMLIIGAGGAGYAAVIAAVRLDCKIILANRNVSKAITLAKHVKKYYNTDIEIFEGFVGLPMADIVVQTTPLGFGDMAHISPLPSTWPFASCELAFDLNYYPRESRFLADARKAGVNCVNGLEMLVLQASESFEIWSNIKIPNNIIQETINEIGGNSTW